MTLWRRRLLLSVACTVLVARPVLAGTGLEVVHHAPACAVAERFVQLNACAVPAEAVVRAHLRFRAHGTGDWYQVEMEAQAGCLTATLPPPLPTTQRIEYFVEAVDTSAGEARTPVNVLEVVPTAEACGERDVAGFLRSATARVSGPGAAPAVPPGFLAVTSTTVPDEPPASAVEPGSGEGGQRSGGGLSGKTILLAGGGAAAVAAGLLAAGGGKDPLEVDDDGDGFSEKAGDCNDGDATVFPGGPITATAQVSTPSIHCSSQFRAAVTVTNKSCSAVSVTRIQLRATMTGGTNCGGGFETTFTPTLASVASGQTATVFDGVPTSFCCVGSPCSSTIVCIYATQFTVVTSGGSPSPSGGPLTVTFDRNCPVCSGSSAAEGVGCAVSR